MHLALRCAKRQRELLCMLCADEILRQGIIMSISSATNAKCVDNNRLTHSESTKITPDKIDEFFKKHTTIRRLVVFSPLILVGIHAEDRFGPYRVLPQSNALTLMSGLAFGLIWAIYMDLFKHASNVDRSLQNKKIEHLNS